MDDEKILNASALSYLDQLDSSRYPRTKSEADKMSEVLQQAYDAADNTKDEVFVERYQTLRGIADWSQKRHKSWQWTLVVAALVGAAVLYFFQYRQQSDILQARVDREQVAQWKTVKVNHIDFDVCPSEQSSDEYSMRLTSAERYKVYKLVDLKRRALADSAQYVALRATYDSINTMEFAQIHELALGDLDAHVDHQEWRGIMLYAYMIYLLVLIPLYIITGYPHGYTITRRSHRPGCLNIFRKVGTAVAMFCLGAGVASTLLPDYVGSNTTVDGKTTKHRERGFFSALLIIVRVVLIVVGAVLLCIVASVVMTIESIVGLVDMFRKCA